MRHISEVLLAVLERARLQASLGAVAAKASDLPCATDTEFRRGALEFLDEASVGWRARERSASLLRSLEGSAGVYGSLDAGLEGSLGPAVLDADVSMAVFSPEGMSGEGAAPISLLDGNRGTDT